MRITLERQVNIISKRVSINVVSLAVKKNSLPEVHSPVLKAHYLTLFWIGLFHFFSRHHHVRKKNIFKEMVSLSNERHTGVCIIIGTQETSRHYGLSLVFYVMDFFFSF